MPFYRTIQGHLQCFKMEGHMHMKSPIFSDFLKTCITHNKEQLTFLSSALCYEKEKELYNMCIWIKIYGIQMGSARHSSQHELYNNVSTCKFTCYIIRDLFGY